MRTALVGVVGALIGILLSNVLALFLDLRRRRERVKDVQTSLRAEIRSHWHRLKQLDLEKHSERIAQSIREADERGEQFTPFVPREDPTIIFGAVAHEIHILPTDIIDPVILYYAQTRAIAQFAEDLRSERYATLDARRKIEMHQDFIAMNIAALDLAEQAIAAIDATLKSGETQ